MAVYDLEEIKENVVATLRNHFAIENDRGTEESTINPDYYTKLAQSFIPFSTIYRNETNESFPVDIMIKKVGSPPDLEISLWSSSNGEPSQVLAGTETTIPAATIPTSFGTYSRGWIVLEDYSNNLLGSNTEYFLMIQPVSSPSTVSYYVLQNDSIDFNFWFGTAMGSTNSTWSSLNFDLRFKMSLPTWIYSNYPHVNLGIDKYPRMAVDLIGKPRTRLPWIDHRLAKYEMNLAVVIYSTYAEELSDLLAYQDRILFKERINIPGIVELIPGNFTSAAIPRGGLFARTGIHRVKFHMIADQYP